MAHYVDEFISDFDKAYLALDLRETTSRDPLKLELDALEVEKEELLDELNDARATISDRDAVITALQAENERLRKDNALLRKINPNDPDADYVESLSDAIAMLAKYKSLNKELILEKEICEKKLQQERMLRLHSEKERDAYAEAFNSSMGHFDRWTASQNLTLD